MFEFIFPMFFVVFFIIFLVVFITAFVKGVSQWHKNNNSPRLTVDATVISKRTNVSHHNHSTGDGVMQTSSTTTYYVAFQVESGDRMEFHVSGYEYNTLIEHDFGKLSFQGTRFLGFERQ